MHLERPHAIEITFLAIATLYSLTLPFKRTLTIVDAVILISIFVVFVIRISRAPSEEPHLVGPGAPDRDTPDEQRRAVVGVLLAYAAAVIFACAEPFAESLVHLGEQAGISTFLLVQWVAPLASEAPELIVAGMFAWRLNTSAGFGTLLSSKVNQWTLLVGSLPIVFAISAGVLHGLPLDSCSARSCSSPPRSRCSRWPSSRTAASACARRSRCSSSSSASSSSAASCPADVRELERIIVGIVYLVLAAGILIQQRKYLRPLVRDGLVVPVGSLFHEELTPSSEAEGVA